MSFNHESLTETFKNIVQTKEDLLWNRYVVKGPQGDIGEIILLDCGKEWRFIVDNYPGQRKFYQNNIPYETRQEFAYQMQKIGLPLILKPEHQILEDDNSEDGILVNVIYDCDWCDMTEDSISKTVEYLRGKYNVTRK